MNINNRRAAVLYYAALVCTGVVILLADWTYQKASDGVYLGTFPLLYLLLAGGLIAITMVDSSHRQRLHDAESISSGGIGRIAVFAGVVAVFAFFQESVGFIPCVALLTAVGVVLMGERSPIVYLLFAITTTFLLYVAISSLGASIIAWPAR